MIISVASGKGGVGKTTVTANLGSILAKEDLDILLADADLASGNLAHYLGVKNPNPTLQDVLSNDGKPAKDAIVEINEGLNLLPAGSSFGGFLNSDLDKLKDLLPDLAEDYDLVFLDLPPGISKNSIGPLRTSDQVMIVVTPDNASVSSAENIIRLSRLVETELRGFVINKRRERSLFGRLFGEDTQMEEGKVETALGIKNLGTIPEDENLQKATEVGEPIYSFDEDGKAAERFKELSSRFLGKSS